MNKFISSNRLKFLRKALTVAMGGLEYIGNVENLRRRYLLEGK